MCRDKRKMMKITNQKEQTNLGCIFPTKVQCDWLNIFTKPAALNWLTSEEASFELARDFGGNVRFVKGSLFYSFRGPT